MVSFPQLIIKQVITVALFVGKVPWDPLGTNLLMK